MKGKGLQKWKSLEKYGDIILGIYSHFEKLWFCYFFADTFLPFKTPLSKSVSYGDDEFTAEYFCDYLMVNDVRRFSIQNSF